MEGIFAIYKPKGISSNSALNILRKKLTEKKIGHAGTLDPLAEGVLVVGVGRDATRKLNEFVAKEKEYIGEIKLGSTSTTDDDEGEKTFVSYREPQIDEIEENLKTFIGNIKQTPPLFSAAKVRGVRAHARARAGELFNPGAHDVEIKEIKILSYDHPILKLNVTTGPGVYIRSLARDLGASLKTGGYLTSLVRTRVGDFTLETAQKLETTFQK